MAGIPEGITTALVHMDAPVSFIGDVGRLHVTIEPSVSLIWAADGTPIGNFTDTMKLDPGQELQVYLPHTDQAGFLDGNGNTFTGWYYTVKVVYEKDGQRRHFPERDFQIPSGQVEVDLALVPSGEASPVPEIAPILPVTSIDGLNGEVTLAGLGLDLVDNTPDSAKPVSAAQQSALDLKLDLIKVTENVAKSLGWAIVTDTQFAGGAKSDNSANAQPAVLAALQSTAKVIYFPAGTYRMDAHLDMTPFAGKRMTGSGANSVLKFSTAITAAALLGISTGTTDQVFDNFVIDMQWVTGQAARPAVQFTNAARLTFDRLIIKNSGGQGILLQGLNADGGTSDSKVTNCLIDGAGLSDGTTGFGVMIKDNSKNNIVTGNTLKNIKGGMGIGMNGAAGTGYPAYNVVTHNHITMVQSATGFEAIGITSGCNHNTICNNVIPASFDNGLSISGSYNTVTGNVVGTCWNHGISVWGSGNTIVGNTVRNCGRESALEFGGVSIEGGWNTVTDNFLFDDNADASPYRMSYKVKFVNSLGNNRVGPNQGHGQLVAEYTPLNSGRVVSDVVATTAGTGWQFEELSITGTAATPRVLRLKTAGVSRWGFVADSAVESGANTGSNLAINAYDDAGASLGTVLSATRATRDLKFYGDLESNDVAKGLIIKSPNGTRFRIGVADDGAVTTTSL